MVFKGTSNTRESAIEEYNSMWKKHIHLAIYIYIYTCTLYNLTKIRKHNLEKGNLKNYRVARKFPVNHGHVY